MSSAMMKWNGLPKIKQTFSGEITKEAKTNSQTTTENGYGSTFPAEQLYNGASQNKGRGNSTWTQPKKPRAFTTTDAAFKKKAVSPFGMPADSDWILLANYVDKTFIKSILSSSFSYALGLPWASRMQLVELEENGVYRGLYTFCEKIKVAPARINIAPLGKTELTLPALSGGYVVEQQFAGQLAPEEGSFNENIFGFTHGFKAPDGEDVKAEQIAYAKSRIDDLHHRIMVEPLSDVVNGYRSVMDVKSWCRFALLQDLCKNMDAYRNSHYTTFERNDPKARAGPGWDFDNGFALQSEATWTETTVDWANPYDTMLARKSPVMRLLLTDPYFNQLLKETWLESLPAIHQAIADADDFVVQLNATGAPDRDRALWPAVPAETLFIPHATYLEDAQFVLKFVKERTYYFTRQLYDYVPPKPVN